MVNPFSSITDANDERYGESMTIEETLAEIKKELQTNKLYLEQIGKYYSLYQNRVYRKLFHLINQAQQLLQETMEQES